MKPSRLIVNGVLALLLSASFGGRALASQEAEDLKRQIESQRAQVGDFERLDERHAVTDEIALLKTWLDEAWGQYSKEEFKKVREVIDRCLAQAELIRQRINASKMTAYADDRERAVRASRDRVAKTKSALIDATSTKKALEMNNR
jgi:hypothetical protein